MEVNGVEFEEDHFVPRRRGVSESVASMEAWLMRKKIVRSPIQANILLFLVILGCIAVSVGAFILGGQQPVGPTEADRALFEGM